MTWKRRPGHDPYSVPVPDLTTVTCRPDGLHIAATPRLWIVSARMTDLFCSRDLMIDPEARYRHGLRPEDLDGPRFGLMVDALDDPTPPLRVDLRYLFFAGIDQETNHLVTAITITSQDGVRYSIGGTVAHDHRNAGYGRESLAAVVGIVHRHLGIPRLTAGCETTNLASRRWLAGAGFRSIGGPSRHTLPNGRVIDSLWWEHLDEHASRECPHLRRPPRFRSGNWWSRLSRTAARARAKAR